jgi:hypothetical protein
MIGRGNDKDSHMPASCMRAAAFPILRPGGKNVAGRGQRERERERDSMPPASRVSHHSPERRRPTTEIEFFTPSSPSPKGIVDRFVDGRWDARNCSLRRRRRRFELPAAYILASCFVVPAYLYIYTCELNQHMYDELNE